MGHLRLHLPKISKQQIKGGFLALLVPWYHQYLIGGEMLRRILGGVLFFGAILVGGYLISYNNNLVNQPVILQPQTWKAIIVGGIMALIGLTLLLDKEETP